MKRTVTYAVSVVLALACILCFASCESTDPWANATYTADTAFGEGEKTLDVEVKVGEHAVTFTLHTDKTILADALLEHGLIAGEDSEYGLYMKVVNGMTADYDVDKSYWSLYRDGEYMLTGVSQTAIVGGEHFEIVYTK